VLVACAILSQAVLVSAQALGERTLRQGSQGPDVVQLQAILESAGFDPGPADGIFGSRTAAAVRAAQAAGGLTVDGVVGPSTIAYLQRRGGETSRAASTVTRTPPPLAGRTIVLDPGHGGGTGATGPAGTREDDNVVAIGRYARDLLAAAGAKVVMTRTGANYPSGMTYSNQLTFRVNVAERNDADLFISIHNNWNGNSSIRGLSVYYTPDSSRPSNRRLAQSLQSALVKATGMVDKGVMTGSFAVIRRTSMPAVLLEIGFMSNRTEERALTTETTRRAAAQGILNGVCAFYGVKPGPVPPEPPEPPQPPGTKPVVLAYWAQWGTDQAPWQSLSANIKSIDIVAPYWYSVRADGTLQARESNHKRLVDLAHQNKKKVAPLVNLASGAAGNISSATWRTKVVDAIAAMVRAEGADGVNIDFENLPAASRSSLTAFVKAVAAKLSPSGLLTTVAVGAKKDEETNDWAACYDYKALGQAADLVVVMTYDQHGQWSGAGAVAGIDWVKAIETYAASLIPPKKLLLGVAGYGYDWSSAGTVSATAGEAMALASRYGATIAWDDVAQEPHFSYTRSGVKHAVWFENSYACSRKMRLARDAGLGGIALWSIGQEDARFWTILPAELGL
jgi:spore germination protein YaaH/N-acetylmuramoyl-L-alanine amidase